MFHPRTNSFFLDYRPAGSVDKVLTLSIDYCGNGHVPEKFQRVIEVPSDLSLIKLHLLMQHVTGIDEAQIDAFYLASSLRGMKTWLKRHGAWLSDSRDGLNLSIHEIFAPRTNRKLFYSSDFGGNWMFRISRVSADDMPLPERKYPRVVQDTGIRPI